MFLGSLGDFQSQNLEPWRERLVFGVSELQSGVPKLGDVAGNLAFPDNAGTARAVADLDPERLGGLLGRALTLEVVAVVFHRPATGRDSAWRDPRLDFKIANARLVCVFLVSTLPCQHISGILERKPGIGALLDRPSPLISLSSGIASALPSG